MRLLPIEQAEYDTLVVHQQLLHWAIDQRLVRAGPPGQSGETIVLTDRDQLERLWRDAHGEGPR